MKRLLTTFAIILSTITAVSAQYCVPDPGGFGCTDDDMIDDFILYGAAGTSIQNNNTGCALTTAYEDFTAQSVSLAQGNSYVTTVSTQYVDPGDNFALWIDFNDNFTFESNELVGSFLSVSVAGSLVPITIPTTAAIGSHRMRAQIQFDVDPTLMDPCNTLGANDYIETHDYSVNILASTCFSPTALSLTSLTSSSAGLMWNGSAPQYSIEYGPAGFILGTGTYSTTSGTSATLNTLSASTTYNIYVRSLCSTTDSSSATLFTFTTPCSAVNVPYSENFDAVTTPDIPACMSTEDVNSDNATWITDSWLASSFPNSMSYWSTFSQNADDWFFTPGINMTAGNTYNVSFAYSTDGFAAEALEVKAGTQPSANVMGTTALFSNSNITNSSFQTASFTYTPSTTGVFYFGWHCTSDAFADVLAIDDISITSTTTTVCDTSLTLTATNVTSSSATINWSAVTGATGYQYVLDQVATDPTGAGTPTNATTYPASGLAPNTTYYFHLRTVCGSGFSDWTLVSFTTGTTTCDTSLILTASSVTANTATINWSMVMGSSGYQYVLDQVATDPTVAGTPTTATTYPASGLTANTTYYFHLRTVCGTSFSNWKTVSFATQPLSVSNVSSATVGLQVYPNPVSDIITIELSQLVGKTGIQLTDISGKVLKHVDINTVKTEIDMSRLAPGVYIIRYKDDAYQHQVKIIKQ